MYLNLFLFLSALSGFVFMANGGIKEEVDSLMSGLYNLNAEDFVANGKFYKPKTGALFYAGSNTGYSEELTLFFKRHFALTNPYLKITFCLEQTNKTNKILKCDEGILLCYESQANSWYTKYRTSKIDLRKSDDPELACENATHFGIHVSASTTHFRVKSSLDQNIYKFAIPPRHNNVSKSRCFVLNMGSNTSLETTITNVAGEKLIGTGKAPENLDPDKPYFDKETMNLWMLLIDFIPYYPPYLLYFPRPFYFHGGGINCLMNAEFSTDTVHACKQDFELIGNCATKNLNSADVDCTVTLSASQSVEEGTEKETSQSTTNTESKTKIDGGEQNTQDEYQTGAKGTFKIPIFGEISVEVENRYRRMWEHKHVWSVEEKKETMKTKGSSETQIYKEVRTKGKAIEMKIHRTDGGNVNFFQLILDCAGEIIRFHKVYAVGDTKHAKPEEPQSTLVHEWKNGSAPVTFNLNDTHFIPSKDFFVRNSQNRKEEEIDT